MKPLCLLLPLVLAPLLARDSHASRTVEPRPPDEPRPGACCSVYGECRIELEEDCGYPEEFMGDGVPCDPDPCPRACCYPDGHCEMLNFYDCLWSDGNPLGVGMPCEPDPCSPVSDVNDPDSAVSIEISPNPTTTSCRIAFSLEADGPVLVEIFDASGRLVRHLLEKSLPAGEYRLEWDGKDDDKRELPVGIYFGRIDSANERRTTRIARVR